MNPTHKCPECGTEYFAPGECDWDGRQTEPLTYKIVPAKLGEPRGVTTEDMLAMVLSGRKPP